MLKHHKSKENLLLFIAAATKPRERDKNFAPKLCHFGISLWKALGFIPPKLKAGLRGEQTFN